MNKKLPLYDKRMTSKLDRTALKIAARTRLFRQPWSQKTVHWLRLLIALALILTAVFASWAPHGLVLPIYYIVSLVLVIALPGSRDRVLVAALCTALMIVELVSLGASSAAQYSGHLLNNGVALAMLWTLVVSVDRKSTRLNSSHPSISY